jgi:hypothetical protein
MATTFNDLIAAGAAGRGFGSSTNGYRRASTGPTCYVDLICNWLSYGTEDASRMCRCCQRPSVQAKIKHQSDSAPSVHVRSLL